MRYFKRKYADIGLDHITEIVNEYEAVDRIPCYAPNHRREQFERWAERAAIGDTVLVPYYGEFTRIGDYEVID